MSEAKWVVATRLSAGWEYHEDRALTAAAKRVIEAAKSIDARLMAATQTGNLNSHWAQDAIRLHNDLAALAEAEKQV